MRLITKWVLFHCVLLLNFQNLAFSQTVTTSIQKHPLPLLANISISPDRLAPGENAQLKFNLSLEKKYKAYSDQFKIEILNPANVKIGKLKVSPEFEFMDSHSKKKRKGFSEKAQLSTVIELSPDTSQGPQELKVKLTFQTCTKKICHLPQSMILMTQLEVVPPQDRFSATPTSSPRTSHSSPSNNIEAYLKKGFALTLLFVFLAGILTSLTPCIFPMIPITLAILGTQQQEEHPQRFRGFTLSFTYVLGIATTYSVLGLIAASTGSVFGSLLGHPIAVTAIASVFILMGLSMYGFFELQVPRFISDRLGTVKTKKSSYSGAFISGTIAGIVASPCVGPVLVGILTYVSQTQNLALGFIFLFTFALGLGQIFIALGTFSSLIKKIPRSGPWLDITKSVFGTVMLAMALYYIEPVASERVFAGALSAFCIFVATILGAFRPTQPKQFLSQLNKAFFLVVFCIGLIFAIKCVFWSEWNQLQSRRTTSPQKKNSFWTPYSDEALKKAQRKGQPVILDFYADWCAACKDLDKKTFSTAEVQSKTKGFLWLKFDATNDSKKLTELQGKYGIQGLPTVILYDAKGRYRKELTLTGFESRQEFIKRVQKLTRL